MGYVRYGTGTGEEGEDVVRLPVSMGYRTTLDNSKHHGWMAFIMSFGDRMRALMEERGVSLHQLANRTNYTVGHLSHVANDAKYR